MSFARLKLFIAALLFAGWLGWLGYAVYFKGSVQIVSRAQLTGASHWVLAEVTVGSDGVPNSKVMVKEVLRGESLTGSIEVRNLPSAATPLPVTGDTRTPPPGLYLIPLVKLLDGLYKVAGLPRSPGYEPQSPERPLIYPWTDDVRKQVEPWK